MNRRQRALDAALRTAYQDAVECLAAIQRQLADLTDPVAYDHCYEATMTPAIVATKRALGNELYCAAMRDAIALARLAA